MNSAMLLTAALALCMLPTALSLKCWHCQGSLDTSNLKFCTNMSEYVEQTCMTGNATCGKTELKSNVSNEKAFVLGCVEEPHNCTSYESSLCENTTMEVEKLGLPFGLATCTTACCSDENCNSAAPPTMSSTMDSTGTATMETTTADAQVFRPERIGMFIALMAVFFGLQ